MKTNSMRKTCVYQVLGTLLRHIKWNAFNIRIKSFHSFSRYIPGFMINFTFRILWQIKSSQGLVKYLQLSIFYPVFIHLCLLDVTIRCTIFDWKSSLVAIRPAVVSLVLSVINTLFVEIWPIYLNIDQKTTMGLTRCLHSLHADKNTR